MEYLPVKNYRIMSDQTGPGTAFSVRYLGIHETMNAGMVDRPHGTGDYLLMLFHTESQVRTTSGGELFQPSSLIVWEPKDGHYYGNPKRKWDHSWVHFRGKQVKGILKSNRVPVRRRIFLPDPSIIENGLNDIAGELRGRFEPDEHILLSYFEIIIRNISRQCSDSQRQPVPDIFMNVRGYLEQHYDGNIRLSALAKQFGFSVSHFCTEFKKHFGVSAGRYLHQIRMNQAALHLRDPNRRIKEIGEIVGYPDPYTFSKMFRRHFGSSPRNFRLMSSRPGG